MAYIITLFIAVFEISFASKRHTPGRWRHSLLKRVVKVPFEEHL